MNEAQTRFTLIDPALKDAGWREHPASIAVEQIAPGRVGTQGRQARRADYVLMWGNRRVAVVEAKAEELSAEVGVPQAQAYAKALGVRFAYATNGRKVIRVDMWDGSSASFPLGQFPTPAELERWMEEDARERRSELERSCRDIPWNQAGGRRPRYYQERAVEAVISAFGKGEKRALLTLATGTGKTYIAFQLVHKLCQARWTRKGVGQGMPRVLFLSYRNFLADQAYNAFSAFGNARCRLQAGNARVPQDRMVYFTLYQTLGEPGEEAVYRNFARDFFDLVIVDECHQGSSNAESAWREVLDYFEEAYQLGLTATPVCNSGRDTYAYFGMPRYVYSLVQGVEDGFLAPYRIRKCDSTLATYLAEATDVISDPDQVTIGEEYSNAAIHRNHYIIEQRDRHFVDELMAHLPWDEKAIVFCTDQVQALRVARFINERVGQAGDYCKCVTSCTGAEGDAALRAFEVVGAKEPMILTTSEKLTTGLDVTDLRAIVLLREIGSEVTFKQIIGRGTRTCEEEKKTHFTIYDFFDNVDKHFTEDWDKLTGCPVCGKMPCECPKNETGGAGKPERKACPVCGCVPCVCEGEAREVDIVLGSGRVISAMWEGYFILNQKQVTAKELLKALAEAVQALGPAESLRARWCDEAQRSDALQTLAQTGFSEVELRQAQECLGQKEYDLLDVMAALAWGGRPQKRAERVAQALSLLPKDHSERREVAQIIYNQYCEGDVWRLTKKDFTGAIRQRYAGSFFDAVRALGVEGMQGLREFFSELQRNLFGAVPCANEP